MATQGIEGARRHTEIGVFESEENARRAVDLLEAAAFPAERIGVVAGDARQARELVGSRSPELSVAGAVAGLVGTLLALVAPGSEVLREGGPLVVALWVAGGAVAGAGVGILAGRVLPRGDPDFYSRVVVEGTVVTVRCDAEQCTEARRLLRAAGAQEVRGEVATDAL